MAQDELAAAPVLSTPDTRIFEDQKPDVASLPRLSDERVHLTYEIQRCVDEIRQGRWKRIALQFPDLMLVDAPRIFQFLSRGLKDARRFSRRKEERAATGSDNEAMVVEEARQDLKETNLEASEEKLFILADTSYGACCVDEVAAEHANADVVIHYGRSCLSPTARLPVIYVFTKPPLDTEPMYQTFCKTYPRRDEKVVLMADIPYQEHLEPFADRLRSYGYTSLFVTSIVHNTASPLPNRSTPPSDTPLIEYSLFHVSDPPPALLLAIASKVASIHIYPTTGAPDALPSAIPTTATHALLRRRYALLTRLSTTPIIGILVNTLSVASYMTMLSHLKRLIASAGKKSYTFVVGKVNAAKIANFAEVGGWVVVGCWESSLFDSSEFWRPVVTPWEMEIALKSDDERVWTGDWRGDFGAVLGDGEKTQAEATQQNSPAINEENNSGTVHGIATAEVTMDASDAEDSEEDSAPPEFDLRTGQYVSHSRPMAPAPNRLFNPGKTAPALKEGSTATTLIKRANGDLATVGGEISPAAEFFKNKRSWQGLGSDYAVEYDGEGRMIEQAAAKMEVGRSGIARGYVVGGEAQKT